MSSRNELTLIEHLSELRRRIFICLAALAVGAVIAFYFWADLLELLKWPARELIATGTVTPIVTQVTERLSTAVKISLVGGLALASPVILYQVIRFVAPGLSSGERKYLFLLLPGAMLAFAGGVAFAFFVLAPRALPFLLTLGGDVAETQVRISSLVDVMLRLLFWMGVSFETPVVMYLLAQLGIVTSRMFSRFRKYWLVVAFILGAIITPTFDPLNQTLVALPLIVLYELGIFLAWLAGRLRRRSLERMVSVSGGE